MGTITIEVDQAEAQLSKLLALALQGNKVVITKNQQPMVQLAPIRKRPQRRVAGLHRGAMRMRDDFNEPLPDSFWLSAA